MAANVTYVARILLLLPMLVYNMLPTNAIVTFKLTSQTPASFP